MRMYQTEEDYWRFFGNENIEGYALNEAICLWETEDTRIAGINVGHHHIESE